MHLFYSAYGLQLRTNLPIPGLVPLPTVPGIDVQVWLQSMPLTLNDILEAASEAWYTSPDEDDRGIPTLRVWELAGGAFFKLLYCDGAEFILDRMGTKIWSIWPDTLTLEDTAVYLLGPVLGFVLRLRGTTCLHASAVSIGGQAIALLGPAGTGKSTTAAGFAKLGYPILSDDVVALSDQNGTFLVQPAYPHLRLWPASVDALYGAPDALPRLVPGDSSWDKRYLNLTENGRGFQQQPLPLTAVYFLGERCEDSSAPFVEAVPTNTGLMTLIANTYANYLLDRAMRAREFELLSRVVASVLLRRVVPHADPTYLSKLCHVILDDFGTLNSSATVGGKNAER